MLLAFNGPVGLCLLSPCQYVLICGHVFVAAQPEIEGKQVKESQGHCDTYCQGDTHRHYEQSSGKPEITKIRRSSETQVRRSEGYEDELRETQAAYEQQEKRVIALPNAVVEPLAVVVKPHYAPVAMPTVLGLPTHTCLANGA